MSDEPTGAPSPPSSPPQPRRAQAHPPQRPPYAPPILWRLGAAAVIGVTGALSRTFLLGLNSVEVHGLDKFTRLLDERADVEGRTRGLLTVSNHLSIMDDPLIWGLLPFRLQWNPDNSRWVPGSHDLMFRNKATSLFFSLGQCLPAHRAAYSIHGGPWQAMMTEAVRLLSAQPFSRSKFASDLPHAISDAIPPTDPFTDPTALSPTFSTTGNDVFPSPSYHPVRKHAWIHLFPEGRIHQHPTQTMRYFRWGVSRLILEAEPCPAVVPIWIEGTQEVLNEKRTFPRSIPRPGKSVRVEFGDVVEEERWKDLRERWKSLVRRSAQRREGEDVRDVVKRDELGVVEDDWLKYDDEAIKLRIEVAERVRNEIIKIRRARGWPEEDPRARLAETWSGGRDGLIEDVDVEEKT